MSGCDFGYHTFKANTLHVDGEKPTVWEQIYREMKNIERETGIVHAHHMQHQPMVSMCAMGVIETIQLLGEDWRQWQPIEAIDFLHYLYQNHKWLRPIESPAESSAVCYMRKLRASLQSKICYWQETHQIPLRTYSSIFFGPLCQYWQAYRKKLRGSRTVTSYSCCHKSILPRRLVYRGRKVCEEHYAYLTEIACVLQRFMCKDAAGMVLTYLI